MKFTFPLLVLVLCINSFAYSQDLVDIIHLKNGDIVKGLIIENAPNDYVRIELQGGSIFTYKYSEIAKFTREAGRKVKQEDSGDISKLLLYHSQKKNPALAGLFSILLPTAGHAYAGEWGYGIFFTTMRFGSFWIAQSNVFATERGSGYTRNDTADRLFILAAIGFYIWEIFDAYYITEKYNTNLYSQLYGQSKNPINFNLEPRFDRIFLTLSYNF